MKIETPENPNYCAIVTTLGDFNDLPGCDFIKGAQLYGTQVIVSKEAKAGDVGLYFPPETQLSQEFVSQNNLYRPKIQVFDPAEPHACNVDQSSKGGFFEQNRRVRCVKFRGFKSEGLWLPLTSLGYLIDKPEVCWVDGDSFDAIGDHPICCKYVTRKRQGRNFVGQPRVKRVEDRIIEGQFRFHPDTVQLRRNLGALWPNSIISVSDKWHGTSVVIGNLLTVRKLTLRDKIARFLGVKVQESDYGLVWSSRKVVKGVGGEAKAGSVHYYNEDVWGYWAKHLYAAGYVPAGYTIYAEIVGYGPGGGAIQDGYAYGCVSGSLPGNKQPDSRILAYRVTYTTTTGTVFELPWLQMQGWCSARGIETVPQLYWGRADGLEPQLEGESVDQWRDQFLDHVQTELSHDHECPYNPGMPAEGVVVRIDHADGTCTALKSKSYAFLEHETKLLDQGVEDIESSQDDEASYKCEQPESGEDQAA